MLALPGALASSVLPWEQDTQAVQINTRPRLTKPWSMGQRRLLSRAYYTAADVRITIYLPLLMHGAT